MRFILACVTAVTLLAGGLTYAQNSGGANNQGSMDSKSGSSAEMAPCNSRTTDIRDDLRAPKDGGTQIVRTSPAHPEDEGPGAMGTPAGIKEESSASADDRETGIWTGRRASDDIDIHPGATPSMMNLRDDAGTTGASPDK